MIAVICLKLLLCWFGKHDDRPVMLMSPSGAMQTGRGKFCERCLRYRPAEQVI